MYKDVQNSNNVDKQMLNQLWNENVIRSYSKQNSKTPVFTALFEYFIGSEFLHSHSLVE